MIHLSKLQDDEPYVKIPNTVAQNEGLSYEAKGLHVELMSRPAGWIIRRTQLMREGCKEEKLKRITDELVTAGLLYHDDIRDEATGQYVTHQWVVSSRPREKQEFLDCLARSGLSPIGANPAHIKQDLIQNKNDIKTEETSTGSADPADPPVLPSLDFKKRYSTESLPFKLADLLITLVLKRRPNEWKKFRTCEEGQYLLIQRHAKHFDLLLGVDHRQIEEVLEVLQWSQEDDFWKDNIRSGEKFRRQYDVLLRQMREKGIGSMRHDHNPELTQKLIGVYRALIASPQFTPSPVQHTKFIVGAERMVDFFKRYHEIERSTWCECLMECLEKQYLDHSKPVFPGNFCSDHTWEVLMPQYLLDAGLVVWEDQEELV